MSSSAKRLTLPVFGPLGQNPGLKHCGQLSAVVSIPRDSTAVANNGEGAGSSVSSGTGKKAASAILRCEELKKAGTFKPMRKWFVLHDDNLNPLSGGSGWGEFAASGNDHHSRQDSLTSEGSVENRVPAHFPAHLEYHDSEKKWREGKPPKADIVLKDCFNIYKKKDKDGLHGHIISVCTLKDTLDIVFDKEQDLLIWMELLLSCQQGGRSAQGRIARPIYNNMWEVNVKGFKPELNNSAKFQISGPHRLAVTYDTVKFFELGSDEPKNFPVTKISGHSEGKSRYLKLRTGWLSIAGRGELEMDVKDQTVAEAIINAIFSVNRSSSSLGLPSKSSHHRLPSTSSSRSSKSRDSVSDAAAAYPAPSAAIASSSGYRPRSESWSNPSISHSLTGSGNRSLLPPGHPGTSNPSSASGQPAKSSMGSAQLSRLVYKGSRHRTASEGNHFDLIHKGRKGAKSILSGSPMSPGSCMSSESAGSSNSLDDSELGYEHRYGSAITPSTDFPPAATILEESSGESWVDPAFGREEARLNQLEKEKAEKLEASDGEKALQPSRLLVKEDSTIDPYPQLYEDASGDGGGGGNGLKAPFRSNDGNVSYAQVECVCGVSSCDAGSDNLASSPSHVHYSTIVDQSAGFDCREPGSHDDYMMMSPPVAFQQSAQKVHFAANESSSSSSLQRQVIAAAERERQRLSILGLDEPTPINMTSSVTSNITSPSSQSSYNAVDGSNDEYALMSPSNETAAGSTFTACKHSRTNSNSSNHNLPSSILMQRYKSQQPEGGGEEPYMDMSPSVPVSSSNNRIPAAAAAASRDKSYLGASPSSALTSHLTMLPLYTDVSGGQSSSAPPTHTGGGSDNCLDNAPPLSMASMSRQVKEGSADGHSPYLLMSPVNVADSKSLIGQLLSSSAGEEPAGCLPKSKRNSAVHVDSKSSVITRLDPLQAQGDEGENSEIYMHMDFGSSADTFPPQDHGIPCPVVPAGSRIVGESRHHNVPESLSNYRISPASSGSLISGTPSSYTGNSDFIHQRGPSLTDAAADEENYRYEDPLVTDKATRAGTRGAGASSSSSLSVASSTTGKTRNIDIPGHGEGHKQAVNSPNTVAARLGSWFRHRAGSMPTRPAFTGRRRHRTQSEGENDLDSGLPAAGK